MPLFEIPKRAGRKATAGVVQKSKTVTKSSVKTVRGGNNIVGKINEIKAMVQTHLGKYADDYILIQDIDTLHQYINACIKNNYISIDTETDGLDPLQNKLAGICIYTYGQPAAYIPVGHISYITNQPLDNQLPIKDIVKEFERLLKHHPDIDMFNANFDIRVLRANGLPGIYCTWDGYLASQILNENDPSHGLKPLHKKYVLKGQGDAFSFDELFNKIPFTLIPPKVGYLYAAHDPVITTELCDYQRKHLRPDTDREDIKNMYWVFKNIEMPCISVVADMEDTGVEIDLDYQQELSIKYNELLEEKEKAFHKVVDNYKKQIDNYRKKLGAQCKLDDPINMGSSTQLAILFYDILKIPPVDKKSPRGTGKEILTQIKHPIADAVLEYRTLAKLVSTYIDKLPDCINPNDGRIHCNFNQYGAVTGRFSSSDPNLQNIPSHNKDIRKMFKATSYDKIISTDTDTFVVSRWDEIQIGENKFIPAHDIKNGDTLIDVETNSRLVVKAVSTVYDNIIIEVKK